MKQFKVAVFLVFLLITPFLLGQDIDPPDVDGLYFAREPSTPIEITYQGDQVVITEEIRVMYRRNREVYALVTFSQGNVPGFTPRTAVSGTSSLPYNLLHPATGQILMDLSAPEADINYLTDNAINELLPRSRDSWSYYSYYYDIVIPADIIVDKSGIYSDTFTISLYTRNNLNSFGGLSTAFDVKTVQLNINAAGIVQLSIVEEGTSPDFASTGYSMDFGELVPDKFQKADLIVKSTTSYSISVESTNRGNMVHSQFLETKIPYQLKFEGIPVDLTLLPQPREVVSGRPATGQQYDRHTIEVIIEEFTHTTPGEYQDVITFTVTAD